MKNASTKNDEIVVEERVSCHQTPQSSKIAEEKNNKTNNNSEIEKASKTKTAVDVEEQVSQQHTPPFITKICPTAVKKKTTVKAHCNRNTKQKEYNKCDKSNH